MMDDADLKYIPLVPFSAEDLGDVPQFESSFSLSQSGALWVRYEVTAAPDDLALAPETAPDRTDGLWQTTCFEIFFQAEPGSGYIELNFAPSGQWAAYAFTGRREGMSDLALESSPEIHLDAGEYWIALEASVQLPPNWSGKQLRGNISAVIETASGHKSYWAIKHAQGAPDFHDPDCFVLALPPEEAP